MPGLSLRKSPCDPQIPSPDIEPEPKKARAQISLYEKGQPDPKPENWKSTKPEPVVPQLSTENLLKCKLDDKQSMREGGGDFFNFLNFL